MNNQHLAWLIVDAMIDDLRQRQGIGDALDAVDEDTREHELTPQLRTVVLTLLNRHVGRNV
jgi:hypothetical protein